MLAATSGAKGKAKKKKWSKGKVREKKAYAVCFTQATFDRILADAPKKMKVITVFTLIEQFHINGSLARRAMQELKSRNLVNTLETSCRCPLYTRKVVAEKA
jgi:small subunit ribosomal protein S25e